MSKSLQEELNEAREYEAKAKAIRRKEKDFWKMVNENETLIREKFSITSVGQNEENFTDKHLVEVGKSVEEICGPITNLDSFKDYLNQYKSYISKTQTPDAYY